jgi:AAHS family 4-hydroxybenzoate transporter-like MFS transporter
MTTPRAIDVQNFINAHKVSATLIVTLLLCFFIVAVDGFNTTMIDFIAT